VNFAVCPDDGTRLKAVAVPRHGERLLMRCPACDKIFTLADGEVVEVDPGSG
jgi:hypothetical protein